MQINSKKNRKIETLGGTVNSRFTAGISYKSVFWRKNFGSASEIFWDIS
jgi:hypothetical protein